MNKGYDYEAVRALVAQNAFTAHIHARGEGVQKIRQEVSCRARRWLVECTHSWLNRFRSLLIRWTKKAKNYFAFLYLVFGFIAWRAIGLLGYALGTRRPGESSRFSSFI